MHRAQRLLELFQPVLSQEGIVQRNIRKMFPILFSLGNLRLVLLLLLLLFLFCPNYAGEI